MDRLLFQLYGSSKDNNIKFCDEAKFESNGASTTPVILRSNDPKRTRIIDYLDI